MKRTALAIALAFALFGCSSKGPSANQDPANVAPAQGAPEFSLENIRGGKTTSKDLHGKVTVVDFWATWCDPCKAEVPHFNKLSQDYKDKDVEIVGIAIESPRKDIAPTVKELGINYTVLVGTDEVVDGFGGIIGYPTTYVVTKDWKIYKKYMGALSHKEESLRKDIEKLLADESAD